MDENQISDEFKPNVYVNENTGDLQIEKNDGTKHIKNAYISAVATTDKSHIVCIGASPDFDWAMLDRAACQKIVNYLLEHMPKE